MNRRQKIKKLKQENERLKARINTDKYNAWQHGRVPGKKTQRFATERFIPEEELRNVPKEIIMANLAENLTREVVTNVMVVGIMRNALYSPDPGKTLRAEIEVVVPSDYDRERFRKMYGV